MLPYFVLLYAVCSIGLLLAYQRTRLFPLYLLKCAWTFFTIMAFAWVLSMSFGDDTEYIRHPTGPFAILLGEPVQDTAGHTILQGGYAASLKDLTGTEPTWIVAALFCMWMTWGLLLPRERVQDLAVLTRSSQPHRPSDVSAALPVAALEYARPPCQETRAEISPRAIFLMIAALFVGVLLAVAHLWLDAQCFLVVLECWFFTAIFVRPFFVRWGGWLLIGALAIAALPIIGPLCKFEWSRYHFAAHNYSSAWFDGKLGQYFINSMMVTLTAVSLTTLLGSMAAYVLARRPLKGRSVVFGAIIASITVPGILIQVPLFLLIKDWSFPLWGPYRFAFMDSRFGLAMIYTALSLPFTIYVLTGFFRTLPGELGEASVIDGCSQWKTFTQIYLPLALPGIATTGIFNFLGAWNEFNLGMIFMSNPNFKTLPIGLYELQAATQYSSAWAPLFAGIVLLCLPTFVIFVFLQERIVAGLTSGGVKG